MEIALLGHMGRDEALADRLVSQGNRLHVIGKWHNPGLVEKVETSGGSYLTVDSITNVGAIANMVEHLQPDMFLTNFDDSLAADVVGVIRKEMGRKNIRKDLLLPCPDKAAAKIEWDKFFLRELVEEIDPKLNPRNVMAETKAQVHAAFEEYEADGIELVVKPRGLTGGKGVWVMGKHFDTYAKGRKYALRVLGEGVEIQEKLEGQEFTLQFFTDGNTIIDPPETYDFPYRRDNDEGPGTGGMGVFTMQEGKHLPFVTDDDYKEAKELVNQVLVKLKERGIDYKGVIYPTFFKTKNGLRLVEINARGGEGELINIVDLAEESVDFAEVLRSIAEGNLSVDSVRYQKLASTLVYLVSPEYGEDDSGPQYEFTFNPDAARANNCQVRYAAVESCGTGNNMYRTVGTSRNIGISALGLTPQDARERIHATIREGLSSDCPLEYRHDIGDEAYIRSLHYI